MSSKQSKGVIELRQLLAGRFPRVRTAAELELAKPAYSCWPTGLPQLDSLLQGGLPKGAITEAVSPRSGSGSALMLQALLRQAQQTRQLAGLIDGLDSFDAAALEQPVLSRLLWVRCKTADEAMKAADILLRDRNLPLLVLDLKMNPAAQLRKISGTTWYRMQRIVQQTATAFLVLTPWPLIASADARLSLENHFTLADLAETAPAPELKFDLTRWSFGENLSGLKAAEAG